MCVLSFIAVFLGAVGQTSGVSRCECCEGYRLQFPRLWKFGANAVEAVCS